MSQSSETPPSAAVSGGGNNSIGAGEIMLFGMRLKVDPIRKSVSMNNLSEYEPLNNNITNELIMAEDGYASADDAVPLSSNASRERKRGVPWTEEEHKLFLVGLHKVGKGDWRGISRNYVKSRTPTQVASHAQKYFLRRTNTNRRRRRSSLFDITTDSVNAMPIEEARNHQERPAQLTMLPLPVTSNNGFPVVPFPVIFSMQGGNQVENSVLIQSDKVNNSLPMLVRPIPVLPMSKSLRMMIDLNSNQQVPIEQSRLSLNLSLSSGQDHLATRDFAMPA